jgi:uncharacterized membrane protein YfcA
MVKEILFGVVVFLTNVIQCVTGFAGTVLAMPFSVLLVGYDVAKPILNLLGLLASVYVAAVCFRHIQKKALLKMTAVMTVGMAAGIFLKRYFAGDPTLLYRTLGAIVIAFAVMNAALFFAKKESVRLPAPVSVLLLLAAGVVHGMFVCGGPLLVTYASGTLRDKNAFRGTLSAAWVLLNGVLFVTDLLGGAFVPVQSACALALLASLALFSSFKR